LEDYYGNTLFDTTFIHNGRVSPSEGYCTDALFDRAISYIEAHRDERFFCYLPTPVTHSPHRGPKDLVAQLKAKGIGRNAELFAQVQNLDANIGRLMKALESTGLVKNTILIYASDQGMNDRGSPQGGNRLGLGFDPAHHVPFMIRVPGAKPAVSTRLAGMIDLFPTLLDFCGVERPKDCDGLSLRPLIQATTGYPVDRTLIIQCPRSRTAVKWKNASVKTDRWRLVDGTMLYDAQKDPRQTTDVAADHPKVVAALRAKYERFWSDLPEPETTWSRHILGAKECQSVTLNAMDWYRGARPWNSRDYQRAGNGAWPVTIARDGRYRFECRRFPREAKKAAEATHAKIRIGESTAETEISADATKATFELDLKAGEYDLETWLTVGGKARGALWVYVKQLSSRS
ncbi:MAG: sulfatase-like hydrolase/transferase, partial [Planctomycetota bacterium]